MSVPFIKFTPNYWIVHLNTVNFIYVKYSLINLFLKLTLRNRHYSEQDQTHRDPRKESLDTEYIHIFNMF